MGFEHIVTAGTTVELPPGSTAGMAIGAQVAQTRPAPVGTIGIGAEVAPRLDLTRASPCRDDAGWWETRGHLDRLRHALLTGGTQGLVGETRKGLGWW